MDRCKSVILSKTFTTGAYVNWQSTISLVRTVSSWVKISETKVRRKVLSRDSKERKKFYTCLCFGSFLLLKTVCKISRSDTTHFRLRCVVIKFSKYKWGQVSFRKEGTRFVRLKVWLPVSKRNLRVEYSDTQRWNYDKSVKRELRVCHLTRVNLSENKLFSCKGV